MHYIVMDMEWNYPAISRQRKRAFSGDIIQIGAIKVNENLEEISTFNVTIKPTVYTKMTPAVIELTGITQKMVDESEYDFKKAINEFKTWIGEDSVFITWSFSDMSILIDNMYEYDLDPQWIPECYDAQILFDDVEFGEGRSFALNYALYHFNEKPESSHDALDDARSTLKVLRHMSLEDLIDDYYAYFSEPEEDYEDEDKTESVN